MIGFEIEIDLPVTDSDGIKLAGDIDLATSTLNPGFTLVTDTRKLVNDTAYSNLEFVSDAVGVVGPLARQQAGQAAFAAQLTEMRRIRNVLYAAGSAPLIALDHQLNTTGSGNDADLAPQLNYWESTGQPGFGDGLAPHYSVGVPLAGLPGFLDQLRGAAPVAAAVPQGRTSAFIRNRHSLAQARIFAAAEINRFVGQPGAPGRADGQTRALDGYLQLAYMQICAVADKLDYNDTTQIKNLTVVVCRSAMSEVYALLGPLAKAYLQARCVAPDHDLVTDLADIQEAPEAGRNANHTFHENGLWTANSQQTVRLIDLAVALLTGNPRIDPKRLFGGMKVIPTHPEENVTMVPMEIRSFGTQFKTWAQIAQDLTTISGWLQAAYLRA